VLARHLTESDRSHVQSLPSRFFAGAFKALQFDPIGQQYLDLQHTIIIGYHTLDLLLLSPSDHFLTISHNVGDTDSLRKLARSSGRNSPRAQPVLRNRLSRTRFGWCLLVLVRSRFLHQKKRRGCLYSPMGRLGYRQQ